MLLAPIALSSRRKSKKLDQEQDQRKPEPRTLVSARHPVDDIQALQIPEKTRNGVLPARHSSGSLRTKERRTWISTQTSSRNSSKE